jgi:hypothetical protein
MAPTISKVKPSLWEASSRSTGLVAGATLAKKRQKIGETELYKVSNNRSLPIRSQASQAAHQARKEGTGDRATGFPAPAAILSQYDTSDNDTGNKEANNNGIGNEATNNDGLDDSLTNDESSEGSASAHIDGAAYTGPKDKGANNDGINDEAAKDDGLYNGLNNGLANDESNKRGAGARTDWMAYAGPKEDVKAAQVNATVGGPRSTKPRATRLTRTATLGMAGTDSVTVWLGLKPPWPCQDQRPLALRSTHGPATKVPTKSGHGFSVETVNKDVSSGDDFSLASGDEVVSADTDDKLDDKAAGAALRTCLNGAGAGGRRLCRCCLLAETSRTYQDMPEALPVFYRAVKQAPAAQRWPGGQRGGRSATQP